VDLESAQVARAAARAGVPWLALRAIVDEADVTLPPFAREARSNYVLPALRHALRGPGAALQLLRLARAARAATASLTAAVQSIGAALP
jgi:adenosylhomocysteine nucleosidase